PDAGIAAEPHAPDQHGVRRNPIARRVLELGLDGVERKHHGVLPYEQRGHSMGSRRLSASPSTNTPIAPAHSSQKPSTAANNTWPMRPARAAAIASFSVMNGPASSTTTSERQRLPGLTKGSASESRRPAMISIAVPDRPQTVKPAARTKATAAR